MTRKELIKTLRKIKKEAEYQDYGWSDLERDLTWLIEEIYLEHEPII